MQNYLSKIELSKELLMTIFIVAFVGLFLIANYFFGFNLSLYVIAMTISIIITLAYPRAGLYAIIFLTFIFERFFTLVPIVMGRSEYKMYPLDLLLVAIICGVIWQLLSKKILFVWKRSDSYLLGFILIILLSFLISVFALRGDISLAFSTLKYYAFYPLLYFLTILLISEKQYLYELFAFAFAAGIGIVGFILYGLITGTGLWTEFTPLTTSGSRILAATHAFYITILLLGTITYAVIEHVRKNVLIGILICIWSIGIIGSLMRNIWLGLALSLVVFVILITRSQRKILQAYIVKIFAVGAIAFLFLSYSYALFPRSKFSSSINSVASIVSDRASALSADDDSINWRYVVWNTTSTEFMHNPFIGIGMGKKIFIEVEKYDYKNFVEVRDVHNSFFAILFQSGIIAFAAFLLFLYRITVDLYRKNNKSWIDVSLFVSLICFFVVAQFQPYLEVNMTAILFWIILGLMRNVTENSDKFLNA